MKKLVLIIAVVGLAGAGLYVHAMNKDELITFALDRARNEYQATDVQIAQIKSLLEVAENLDEQKADEIAIGVIFPATSDDEKEGSKRWFYVGDLVGYLNSPDRTSKPVNDLVYGYVFPLGGFITTNPLTHLVSFHQIYGTCGYHALANAHAVQKLVDEGKQNIRFEDVKRYAQEIFKNLFVAHYSQQLDECKRLASEEQGPLLEMADGKRVAVRSTVHSESKLIDVPGFSKKLRIVPDANFFVLRSSEYLKDLDEEGRGQFLYSLIKNKVTHFLLLRRGHFTMLSVVRDGDAYHMYYLNSTNAPEIGETDQGFITQIDALVTQAHKELQGDTGGGGANVGAASAAAEQARQEEMAQRQREQELRRQREQEARDEEIARKLAQEQAAHEQASAGGSAGGAAGAADPYAGMSERDKRIAQRRARHGGAADINKIHATIDAFLNNRGI